MRNYILFAKPGYEPESPVELFRGAFGTVELAKAHFATLKEYGAEIVLFDGVAFTLVCEYPIWLRNPKGIIPFGRIVNEWGLSEHIS